MAPTFFKSDKERLLVWKWQKTWVARKGDWKLTNAKENHWRSEPLAQYLAPIVDNMELKLFNVNEDPEERIDLAAKYPEKVKPLKETYDNWCKANIGNY